MKRRRRRAVVVTGFCFLTLLAGQQQSFAQQAEESNVTRATLSNGLRVVIVRNALAPVATVEMNYLVGGNETPPGFPGMAHAQEHMAFRGCAGLSADQASAILAQLGGYDNADTQQTITQYFTTVPTADMDIALHVEAACMQGVTDSQEEWTRERGAIEQEVASDLSNPIYKFMTRLNEDMFAGTPYAHDPLGTKESFDATTGDMLQQFYQRWYAPNNAILVVAGDVEPAAALAQIKQLFGSIRKHALPPHPPIQLRPVKPESFTLDSDLPYVLAVIAYRLPGTDSPDYASARILSDVLASQRADLYALVPQGKALVAEFGLAESHPKAAVGYALTELPTESDASAMLAEMKRIVASYVSNGVPAELVEAAKRKEVADNDFERNSISGLAALWSQALAAEGRRTPEEDVAAIKAVQVADVNRVAKRYLVEQNSVSAILKPVASGGPVASKGFGGNEKVTSEPTKPVQLPAWAEAKLSSLQVPQEAAMPTDVTLSNGIRLIVMTEKISPTVTVAGRVRTEANLQMPPQKEGIADVLDNLFAYGTKTLDRLAFQKALDDIAADESAGFDFSLRVLKSEFPRGVQLLADNELNPALPSEAFEVARQQTAEMASGNLSSPEYRASRALTIGLVPRADPELRETIPETVQAITLDDVKQYYAQTIRPDLTTIVVIGDVTPDEARQIIEQSFGSWRVPGEKPPLTLPPIPANPVSAATITDPINLQARVTLAEVVEMNRYDPDYYPLQLGNHILGGGFYATRLFRDLRQNTGYVYDVEVSLRATQSRATYTVTYECDPANVSKARDLVGRDLAAMQNTLVTPGELQQAKAILLRQIPLTESSEDTLSAGLLARAQMDLPLNESFRAVERYFKITAEQIQAAFQKWIRPDGFVEVVLGPAPQ